MNQGSPASVYDNPSKWSHEDIADLKKQLDREYDLNDLRPENLAAAIFISTGFMGGDSDLGTVIRQRLLSYTVSHAVRTSAWYAETYGPDFSSGPIGIPEFESLPLMDKTALIDHGSEFWCQAGDLAFCSYTSGTTTKPVVVARSAQEQAYISNFFTSMLGFSKWDKRPQRVVLDSATWTHGQQIRVPGTGFSLPVSFASSPGYEVALDLLQRKFPLFGELRHIDTISGGLIALLALTVFLEDRNLRQLSEPIGALHSTSHYVTEKCRRFLEEFWNCDLVDHFSFTEIFTTATQCQHCHTYHFDFMSYPEVIDIKSGKAKRLGRGKLAVTGLFPFSQMTPLIRYCTGDLVEVREVSCPTDSVGYVFLGRRESAVDLSDYDRPGEFLSGAEIYDIIDALPELYRPNMRGPLPRSVLNLKGMPNFRLRNSAKCIELQLELNTELANDQKRLTGLNDQILNQLQCGNPTINSLLAEGDFKLSFHSPGSLDLGLQKFIL